MSRRIEDYTFDASEKTVTFVELQEVKEEGVLLIHNVTSQTTICDPFESGLGIASVAGKVVTLAFDTTSMADADDLIIVYEDSGSKTKKAIRNLTAAQGADTALIAAPDANKYIVLHACGAKASGANTNDTEVQMSFEAIDDTDNADNNNDYWSTGIPPGGGDSEPMDNLEGPANTSFKYQCSNPGGSVVIWALYHIMDLAEN